MYVLYIVFQTQILFISSYNIACVRSSATQNLPNLTPPPPPSPPLCIYCRFYQSHLFRSMSCPNWTNWFYPFLPSLSLKPCVTFALLYIRPITCLSINRSSGCTSVVCLLVSAVVSVHSLNDSTSNGGSIRRDFLRTTQLSLNTAKPVYLTCAPFEFDSKK